MSSEARAKVSAKPPAPCSTPVSRHGAVRAKPCCGASLAVRCGPNQGKMSGTPPRIAVPGANTLFGLMKITGRLPAGSQRVTCAPCKTTSPVIPSTETTALTRPFPAVAKSSFPAIPNSAASCSATIAPPPSLRAAQQRHREVRYACRVNVGQRRDPLLRQARPLDIDGAIQPAEAFGDPTQFGKVPAELDDGGGVAGREAARQLVFGQRRRDHRQTFVALNERDPGGGGAGRQRRHAGNDLDRVARREPDQQPGEAAVE